MGRREQRTGLQCSSEEASGRNHPRDKQPGQLPQITIYQRGQVAGTGGDSSDKGVDTFSTA